MENERIEIYNFGPIKEACFDIKKLNIIIGEQASGKSIISKLIYFFKNIAKYVSNYYLKEIYKEEEYYFFDFEDKMSEESLSMYLMNVFGSFFNELLFYKETLINYSYKNNKYTIEYFSEIDDVLMFRIKIRNIESLINMIRPSIEFKENKDQKMNEEFKDISLDARISRRIKNFFYYYKHNVYIPAGRIIYSFLSDYFFSYEFIDDPFYENFQNEIIKLKRSKNFIGSRSKGISFEITELFQYLQNKILLGEYIYQDKGHNLKLSNNRVIKLSDASSGQQETLWIIKIIENYLFQRSLSSFMIEEPEAHIYPTAQYDIVKLFSIYLNNSMNNSLFITTHSPYILGSFNNLIYAYFVGNSEDNKKEIEKIIPKCLWINPEDVNAFKIINGNLVCIIEQETGMIDNIQIDEASRQINSDYDRIFEYE
jgi:predicted ATP-dependent endonuclease of OLD family